MRDRADQLVYSMFKPFVQSPPVDVEAVASQLGISVIRAADLLEDGRLISEDGRASIITRRGLSAERRRFTIAHEIGHLIMFDDRSKPVSRRRRGDSNDTERRCDQIAAALLLPHDWVKSEFAVRDHVFANLARSCPHCAGFYGSRLSPPAGGCSLGPSATSFSVCRWQMALCVGCRLSSGVASATSIHRHDSGSLEWIPRQFRRCSCAVSIGLC